MCMRRPVERKQTCVEAHPLDACSSPHILTQMLVDADGSMRAYSYTNVLRPIVVLEAVDLLRRFGNFVKGRGTSFFANPATYPELQQFCQVRRPRPVGGAMCWVARRS